MDNRKSTAYFEVKYGNDVIEPGVYWANKSEYYTRQVRNYIQYAERIWMQGPRGGVKVIKDRNWDNLYPNGYVTTNEKYMEEFFWLKLRAKQIT